MPTRPLFAALTLLLVLPPAVEAATSSPSPLIAAARLEGTFSMAGKVTAAVNVRGERSGQAVSRIWTFTPGCPTGACGTIQLVRTRAGGTDQLVLHRRSTAYYTGTGKFYAALRCGTRKYTRGESVPFTITVRITAAAVLGSLDLATGLKATYTNSSRTNLTPCVVAPSHDAATYRGTPAP